VQASATAEGLLLLEAAGDGAAVLLADALKGALPLAGGPLQARQARGAARGARALKLALTGAASDARDAWPLLLRQVESRIARLWLPSHGCLAFGSSLQNVVLRCARTSCPARGATPASQPLQTDRGGTCAGSASGLKGSEPGPAPVQQGRTCRAVRDPARWRGAGGAHGRAGAAAGRAVPHRVLPAAAAALRGAAAGARARPPEAAPIKTRLRPLLPCTLRDEEGRRPGDCCRARCMLAGRASTPRGCSRSLQGTLRWQYGAGFSSRASDALTDGQSMRYCVTHSGYRKAKDVRGPEQVSAPCEVSVQCWPGALC